MGQRPPIFIVGAPRSGTSLLQQILREQPGCGSVPREADLIWGPLTHPRYNGWVSEGPNPRNRLSHQDAKRIRARFYRTAWPAERWQRARTATSTQGAHWARTQAKRLLPPLLSLQSRLPLPAQNLQLIEKSVHAPLWLDLVDTIFPDARYIHLVRDPYLTIDSMIDGWLAGARFQKFQVPVPLDIEGYSGDRWCFPLPSGWRDYAEAPLEEVATFQWICIQQSIADFLERGEMAGRWMRVRLEDLGASPESLLPEIRRFAALPLPSKPATSVALPRVNVAADRPRQITDLNHSEAVRRVATEFRGLREKFLYE